MSVLDRFRLDGRTAMITGGSRGLGRAMAQALAEVGADLILVGREAEALALAKAELTIGRGLGGTVLPAGAASHSPAGSPSLSRRVDIVVGERHRDHLCFATPSHHLRRASVASTDAQDGRRVSLTQYCLLLSTDHPNTLLMICCSRLGMRCV